MVVNFNALTLASRFAFVLDFPYLCRMRVFWLLVWLAAAGCADGGQTAVERAAPEWDALLRPGDLAFRRGQGLTSRAVLAVGRGGYYSHVGIVAHDSTGWSVIHAVPGEGGGDRVKREPVEVFFTPHRAVAGAVMRMADAAAAGRAAADAAMKVGVPFDHGYELSDTGRLYCTELVRLVFVHQGIDPTGGRRSRIDLPGFGGEYILPGDLLAGPPLERVYEF